MAGNIKGLTIEIGGNTTKLTDALKEPQKESKNLRSELTQINKSLKLDPSNVDLLNQKQRILNDTIKSTDSELALLKQAQKEFIDSGKNIDSAEYIALEAQIVKTESSLQKLKDQQNNFSGEIQVFGQKVGEMGTKVSNAGQALLPVTAAVTAVGTAAGVAWNEMDAAYDSIAKGTGATGDALKELQDIGDEVFTSLPVSAEAMGSAIADINTRFGLTGDALEQASEQFLKFAEVNNSDVSTSIEVVQKAMADAQIPTEELGRMLDTLTAVSQASGMSTDDLASAVQKNGVAMREMGYSTEETIALLATMEKNGVDTSTVMTGMRKAFQNLSKDGKDGKVEMQAFFDSVSSGSATAEQAIELFGSKAGPTIFTLAQEGKLNFQDMMDTAINSTDQLSKSYEATLDPADKMTVAMNNMKVVGADLFSTLQEMLAPVLQTIADKAKQLLEWWRNLSEGQQEMIIKVGALAAALGPLLIGLGKVMTTTSNLVTYFGNASTMGGKLLGSLKGLWGGITIGTGPLLAIVAAIAAIVGAFATLWNTSEEFRNNMIGIWEGLKSKFEEFTQGIVDRLNSLGFSFKDITEVIKAVWDGFCQIMAPIFETAWATISNALQTAMDVILGIIDVFIALFTGDWEGFNQAIEDIFTAIWDGIKQYFSDIWDGIKGILDVVCGWFGTTWEDTWNSIKKFFEDTWNGIKNFFEDTWNNIQTKCTEVWENVKNSIVNPIQSAYDKVKDIFQGIYDWIVEKIDAAKNFVGDAIEKIKGFFNFEFKWPHIPLPHFTISGSLNPLDWLDKGLPSIGVEWYAKAMDTGMILKNASIFGALNGKALGGGESGDEAVIGVSSLHELVYNATAEATANALYAMRTQEAQTQAAGIDYNLMAKTMVEAMKNVTIQGDVMLDKTRTGQLLADVVDETLYKKNKRRLA